MLNRCNFLDRIAFAAVLLGGLAGCSVGEPGEGEMRNAVQNMYHGVFANNPIAGIAAGGRSIVVTDFRKVECAEAQGRPGFVCSYEFHAGTGSSGQWLSIEYGPSGVSLFIRESDGWRALPVR